MSTVVTHALTPAQVLCALYNRSKPLGMGILHFQAGEMTEEEAAEQLTISPRFDYLKGRVMKVNIPSDGSDIDGRLYDRDNGEGAAQRAIDHYITATS